MQELGAPDYLADLSRELNCPPGAAAAHLEAMRVQLEEHNCGYVLAQRTGLEEETARRTVIRSVARRHPGLDDLRNRVTRLLDG